MYWHHATNQSKAWCHTWHFRTIMYCILQCGWPCVDQLMPHGHSPYWRWVTSESLTSLGSVSSWYKPLRCCVYRTLMWEQGSKVIAQVMSQLTLMPIILHYLHLIYRFTAFVLMLCAFLDYFVVQSEILPTPFNIHSIHCLVWLPCTGYMLRSLSFCTTTTELCTWRISYNVLIMPSPKYVSVCVTDQYQTAQ